MVMGEMTAADASTRRLIAAATLLLCAAVVAIPYWSGRAYRRWMKENHPLARPRAGLERMGTSYEAKRANVDDATEVVGIVLAEISRATSTRKKR
jgi:hypothetical protein